MHKRAREHKGLVKYEKDVKFSKRHPLHIMRIPLPKGLKRTGMLNKIESEYPIENPNDVILIAFAIFMIRNYRRFYNNEIW